MAGFGGAPDFGHTAQPGLQAASRKAGNKDTGATQNGGLTFGSHPGLNISKSNQWATEQITVYPHFIMQVSLSRYRTLPVTYLIPPASSKAFGCSSI